MDNIVVIEAGKSTGNYFRDLWRYRELLYFLSWRDVLVRYKQTLIGILWTILKPLITVVVFTLVFGKIAKMPHGGVPYPILVLSGLLAWQFFSGALSESSLSLISNSSLITKVYFPRMIIPLSSILVSFLDFIISFIFMILLMLWYGFYPGLNLIVLPVFILLALIPALGAGLWFSALNVKYRDFRYIVPFVLTFGLLISPIGYVSGVIPEEWTTLYALNPMVSVIDGFRWSILGSSFGVYTIESMSSVGVSIILFVTGFLYFRNTEKMFADLI